MGFAMAVALSPVQLHGQAGPGRAEPDSFVNQQRLAQRRITDAFDAQMADARRAAFDWGGWYSFHVFAFDDGVESSRTFRRHDLRLWARVSADDGAHHLYVRARTSLLDFNHGDSYDGDHDDFDRPGIERAVYRFDLARAFRVYWDRDIGYELTADVGRDLVVLGSGLTLSMPLDHVAIRGSTPGYEGTVFAGRAVGSSPDIDGTRPIERTRRMFYGAQLVYRGFERHRPFAYLLWQRDQNSDAAFPLGQRYDYDSFYVGLGSHGELSDHLRYAAELVYQTGRGSNHGFLADQNEIEAVAARAELEYLFTSVHKPRASIEYLFAGGDADRRFSPTDTLGGNRGDHSDDAFIAFGYVDTGLSFAPRPTNLHMWRAGASYYPFPGHFRLDRLEVGADWYLFHKHHRDGAVSDPTADLRSGYLGSEFDCFASFNVAGDLAWTARFGTFFPGDAFEDRTTRTFVLVGMVWSF